MRLPGFTAALSLYNTAIDYRRNGDSSLTEPRPSQTVSPQIGLFGFDDFASMSIAYCPEGRVCYRGHCWCV
jgi:hypothetical protein